ncbi:hypothetical protein A464_1846 [Salmonella bongori N268-08]|uniref:Uncharacterized protein n=1 Tax=Salmonella bongori N268-08 TaxID=1197719 RepID=S5MQQ7_SALBN|nr:hypothetical protein A464_1846 [Salmonella bongori N268-08]
MLLICTNYANVLIIHDKDFLTLPLKRSNGLLKGVSFA